MPGSLALAVVASGAVFPQTLSTSYSEDQSFPVLQNQYKDGSIQTSLIQDGVNAPRPLRTWSLSKKLTAAQMATLQTFYSTVAFSGLNAFYFYSPFDQTPGHPVGSNYDPTGASTTGRVTVNFKGQFSYTGQLQRVEISDFGLVEVA